MTLLLDASKTLLLASSLGSKRIVRRFLLVLVVMHLVKSCRARSPVRALVSNLARKDLV